VDPQTHYIERRLDIDVDTRCFFSTNPGRKAILFVHGYGGDAISTWADFDRLLLGRTEFSSYDLIFYGYNALYSELISSSTLFQEFLAWLLKHPVETINRSLPPQAARTQDFAYDEVVIVAHSLGAVIARWALLQATNSEAQWVKKTKLALFAPAHMGANVVKLALEVCGGIRFLLLFSSLARMTSPLIDQLRPGSPELISLRSETALALATGNCDHLVAKRVCIAEFERIVSNLRFCSDPTPIPIRGTSHKRICKPSQTFLRPVKVILECL
jgi:pimeloyl-ACP methyl ester carboxylesterase